MSCMVLQLSISSLCRGVASERAISWRSCIVRALCSLFLLSSLNVPFVVGGFRRRASTPLVCCITVKHNCVYARNKAVRCLLSFSSKLMLKHSYKCEWFSKVSLCFSHFRWKHRGHVVCVSLPVPGRVADGARGLGGVASELRDLLQGEGDQLQGESLGRQVARQAQLHLLPCGPLLMNTE